MFAPVDAPPARPPRFGLVAQANKPEEADDRWVDGLAWDPEICGFAGVADACGSDNKPMPDNTGVVEYQPFVVFAGDHCSTLDRSRDRQARARRALEASESFQIARELWTGDLADASGWDNIHLADAAAVDVIGPAGGLTPIAALACLEQASAEAASGARVTIHATLRTVTTWAAEGLIERDSGFLVTKLGSIVIADAGYPGTAPDGTTDTEGHWAYGTGIVDVRRSAITVLGANEAEQINRRTNHHEVIAERMAAATFDPCVRTAVLVQLTSCTA